MDGKTEAQGGQGLTQGHKLLEQNHGGSLLGWVISADASRKPASF